MGVYSRILRAPGIASIFFATLLGRLPIGISGLAILLYVHDVHGSFASAGVCAGALAFGSAAGAPLVGRIVDWRGVGALLPLAVVHAAGLALIWLLGALDAPTAAIALACFATGTTLPPLSSVLRSRWPVLLAQEPALVPSAYALDSVMIEVIFVTGPLITTAIVALAGPGYALAVSAGAVLAGTTMMLAGLHGRDRPDAPEAGSRRFGLGALGASGMRTLVLASLPVGFALGTVQVVVPAFATEEGAKELAGVLLAVWSAASGAAGLAYGARPATARVHELHLLLGCLLPGSIAVLLLAGSPLAMGVLVVLSGAPVAPLIASRNQLVERVAPRGTATEAFTWPLTALVAGVALGASVGGSLVEERSWEAAVLAAVVVAAAGALLLLARRRTLAPGVAAPR